MKREGVIPDQDETENEFRKEIENDGTPDCHCVDYCAFGFRYCRGISGGDDEPGDGYAELQD